jgi:hypothetical protein
VVDSCDAGWGNCDSQDPNGCETDTTSDVDNCNTCGNVCTFDHAAANCVSSQCVMGACDAGYYDIDGLSTTGCECPDDPFSDLCDGSITNLGILGDGDVVNVTGNIVPAGDEDWYTFAATDDNGADISGGADVFNLHVALSGGGPTTGIYFDLYRNTNMSTSCSGKGSPLCIQEGQDFSWVIDCPQSGVLCGNGTTTACTCTDQTARYWLRVYRISGSATCDSYQIDITHTQ